MKLGFGLAIVGLLLVATFTVASGIGPEETSIRLGRLEYLSFQWATIFGGGLFLLGLVRIITKSIERKKTNKEDQ